MITRQPNGRYKVTLDRPTATRKRDRISRTFDTEAEADAFVAKVRRRPTSGDGRTVDDAVGLYLDAHRERLAAGSFNTYTWRRGRYIAGTALGAVVLDGLDGYTLETVFYRALFDGTYRDGAKPLSTNTVAGVDTLLTASFEEARRARWITSNPADDARVLGEPSAPRAVAEYHVPDVARILDRAPDLVDLADMGIATGARIGELAGVRWRDLDLDVGEVFVWGSITRPKGDPRWRLGTEVDERRPTAPGRDRLGNGRDAPRPIRPDTRTGVRRRRRRPRPGRRILVDPRSRSHGPEQALVALGLRLETFRRRPAFSRSAPREHVGNAREWRPDEHGRRS